MLRSRMKALFPFLSLLVLIAPLWGCAPSASDEASEQDPAVGESLEYQRCRGLEGESCTVFQGVNFQRSKNRLSNLRISPRCQALAEEQAKALAAQGAANLERLDHGAFFERAAELGINGFVGENLAVNYSATAVVNAWMNSSPHRANLLDRRFRLTGIAVARDRAGNVYYSQCFSEEPGV